MGLAQISHSTELVRTSEGASGGIFLWHFLQEKTPLTVFQRIMFSYGVYHLRQHLRQRKTGTHARLRKCLFLLLKWCPETESNRRHEDFQLSSSSCRAAP